MPKLWIAAKLYVIFALLATVTRAGGSGSFYAAPVALTKQFEAAFVGAENVEHINSLIYAVVMESRGIYMSPDIATAKKFAVGLTRFNDEIGSVVEGWQKSLLPEGFDPLAGFAARVQKFQELRRELVRRGTEISPASGREWGDNDANRTVRTALTNDLDKLGNIYSARSRQIFSQIERDTWATALEMAVLGGVALLLAMFGAGNHRSVAQPLAVVTHALKPIRRSLIVAEAAQFPIRSAARYSA